MVPPVPLPDIRSMADWSEHTLAVLEELSATERTFVEWVAAADSATEAYRKATGHESKEMAYRVRHRPHVKTAVVACLQDRNVGARVHREWRLARLKRAIDICTESPDPRVQLRIGRLIVQLTQLLGEMPPQQQHHVMEVGDGDAGPGDVHGRLARLYAFAEGFIRGGQAETDRRLAERDQAIAGPPVVT